MIDLLCGAVMLLCCITLEHSNAVILCCVTLRCNYTASSQHYVLVSFDTETHG